jgi:hypothetical protein
LIAASNFDERIYLNIIKNTNGYSEVENNGMGASGLAYTYTMVDKFRKDFKKGDTLIVSLTTLPRYFFFKDRPWLSSVNIFKSESTTPEEKEATKNFFCYLQNLDLDWVILRNFLYTLDSLSSSIGLKTICLPCFDDVMNIDHTDYPNIIIASGCLKTISDKEINCESLRNDLMMSVDPRSSHMCFSNHAILARKIIDSINTGSPINLHYGFVENIITEENIMNVQEISKELIIGDNLYKWQISRQ